MKRISGAEFPLSKIFSSDFEFVIPSYQRPYAWGETQTSELLDDLLAFADDESEEGYFLGSIVLIKTEDAPRAEVIDGQQRLTTLTILLAAAAAAHGGANKDDTRPYILEPGKKMEGIKAKPRLALRERDREFFAKYIQNLRLEDLLELDSGNIENESRRNIQTNARYLLTQIEKRLPGPEAVECFINFLLTRCYLVAVSTPSQESAFRVFSVMNSRGLDLQHTDIIKADMIGQIAGEAARQTYNDKWEDMEVELTRSGFNDLFSYIRMIYAKEKSKRTLLEDFRSVVLPHNSNPQRFIDAVLEPFAESLLDIRSATFAASTHAEEINYYLRWLNRIDNSDWVPAAMLFMTRSRNKPRVLARFLKLLERLAAFMHASRYNVNERIEAYAAVITEIESSMAPDDMESLQFDRPSTKDFREALNGDIYQLTPRRRNYLILRLDSFISDGAATYDPSILTIEHVLPQNVAEGSKWEEWWPDEEQRNEWVHRIANLVPLNKKRNSAAQNFDFADKRNIYFKGTRNVSSYALTTQVLGKEDWTPKYLKARQKELVNAMMSNWELDI
ncbi:DUF262 domain-containing HNH endonuclease family protein (plasmid) [Rhizobium sp. WSM4643]|uniref:DUF262 domain-containing protein n=1 Tax=Rhizobium sp. WSM4643 TaxID=3138253 RepID=UPI0021A798FA|nr:DUF262 domain-containing HNH endonuclease family protein [Rhizobium leguminosarum]UWM78396.1 DUF262 domain-containing HNH endonuclease family protein [Rhizobium leguminosarum bv. viciae]